MRVDISTQAALREMIGPGVVAILAPVVIGFWRLNCRPRRNVGRCSSIWCSTALFMANAGGAWDNAKKAIEQNHEGAKKGDEAHDAAVIGDTIGDPFKDTSGPSLNIFD